MSSSGGSWFATLLLSTWALVIASFSVASALIAEWSLSFLGLDVPSEVPTWGNMLSEGREYLGHSSWLVTFLSIAIALTVLGINGVGDWIRAYGTS